jgi:hypothetical protein
MKTFCWWILAAGVVLAGCVAKKTAHSQAQASFLAGQQQAGQQAPVVFVRGEVKRNVIPWHEGLTLAEAVAAADYRGLRDPKTILMTRQGASVTVNVRQLLQGRDNLELLPGDVLELRR